MPAENRDEAWVVRNTTLGQYLTYFASGRATPTGCTSSYSPRLCDLDGDCIHGSRWQAEDRIRTLKDRLPAEAARYRFMAVRLLAEAPAHVDLGGGI